MQVRITLSVSEIKEAIREYAAKMIKVEEYTISESSFIYDEEEGEEHTPIEGALIFLANPIAETPTP